MADSHGKPLREDKKQESSGSSWNFFQKPSCPPGRGLSQPVFERSSLNKPNRSNTQKQANFSLFRGLAAVFPLLRQRISPWPHLAEATLQRIR
jgi:hypothetical protein